MRAGVKSTASAYARMMQSRWRGCRGAAIPPAGSGKPALDTPRRGSCPCVDAPIDTNISLILPLFSSICRHSPESPNPLFYLQSRIGTLWVCLSIRAQLGREPLMSTLRRTEANCRPAPRTRIPRGESITYARKWLRVVNHLLARGTPTNPAPSAPIASRYPAQCYSDSLTRLVLFCLPLLGFVASNAAAQPSPLLDAMSQELNRNFTTLKEKADPPPYFLSYEITEQEFRSVTGTLGTVDSS